MSASLANTLQATRCHLRICVAENKESLLPQQDSQILGELTRVWSGNVRWQQRRHLGGDKKKLDVKCLPLLTIYKRFPSCLLLQAHSDTHLSFYLLYASGRKCLFFHGRSG